MVKISLGGLIQARHGCVIFFPSRKKDNLIYSSLATRRKWGEQWVQLSMAPINVEVRLEGDNSVDLGNGLYCDVVAKLSTQIDNLNLLISVPKVVEQFLCATTMDKNEVLGESSFKITIYSRLQGAVLNVLQTVSYHDLISDWEYVVKVQEEVKSNIGSFIEDSGFLMLYCSVKLTPLDPRKNIGVDPKIIEKWDKWEHQLLKIQQEKEHEQKKLEDEGKKQERELKEATDKAIREIEIREFRSKKDAEREKAEIEKEQEQIKQEGRVETAKIRAEAEQFFQTRQEAEVEFEKIIEQKRLEKDEFLENARLESKEKQESLRSEKQHERALNDLKAEEELENQRHENKKKRALDEAKYKSEIRQQEIQDLEQERDLYKIKKESAEQQRDIEMLQAELIRAKGLAEAEVLEAKTKARNAGQDELRQEQIKILATMQDKLPEILKSFPTEKYGETTLIQIGGGEENTFQNKAGLEILGLAYMPIVKQIMALLESQFGNSGNNHRLDKVSVKNTTPTD